MDEKFSHYHLYQRRDDLMRERNQDRLAALIACDERPTWRRRLQNWLIKSAQVADQSTTISITRIENEPPCMEIMSTSFVERAR